MRPSIQKLPEVTEGGWLCSGTLEPFLSMNPIAQEKRATRNKGGCRKTKDFIQETDTAMTKTKIHTKPKDKRNEKSYGSLLFNRAIKNGGRVDHR